MTNSSVCDQPPQKPGFHYGYIIIAAAFVVSAAVEGLLYSFGVFFKPLLEEFDWTRSATAGAFTLFSFLHIPGVFIVGKLTDRFGSRPMLSFCGFFLGLGYMLMSRIHTVWDLYFSYGVIVSIGMSFYWIPLITLIPRWFVRKTALMMGIVLSGVGMGQMIFPPLTTYLICLCGWRASFLIVGGASLAAITGCAVLLKPPPARPRGWTKENSTLDTAISAEESWDFSLSEAFRTRAFWLVCALFLSFLFCLGIVTVHSIIHAIGVGMSPAGAANILAIIGLMGIISKAAMGRLADRIGNRSVYVIASAMMLFSFVWIAHVREAWALYSFAAIFGVAAGVFEVLLSPLIAEIFGLSALGALSGTILAVGLVGFGIGPVVAGYVFDVTRSYQIAFLIGAFMALLGLLSAVCLPKRGSLRAKQGR